jgi:ssDNA-binding protein
MENLITPEFRAAFISVFRATSMKNADGSTSKPKYSIRAVFPPTADLSALKKEAKAVAAEKWGENKIPKTLRSPFRLNEELEAPIEGIGDDWVVMSFSANEDRRPGLVDAKLQDITDDMDVYSGAWYRAQVRAFAYDTAGNKGVSFGLQNVQKLRDDDPLGNGRIPASKAFEPVDVPANAATGAKTATSIFG